MQVAPHPYAVPLDPSERIAWIKSRLAERGLDISKAARECGVSRQAVQISLEFPTSKRVDETLAALLDMAPRTLFPERYDAEGNRTGRSKRRKAGAEHSIFPQQETRA